MSEKINVSIIGATGYTALELIRLLVHHPKVKITNMTSTSGAGKKISEIYPFLVGVCENVLCEIDYEKIIQESDVVFLCLPHLESQKKVKHLIGKVKIIDLSADFRLQNVDHFEKFYNCSHLHPELLPEFVYGLPEWNKESIQHAHNVANIGCFAGCAQLALLPLKGNIKNVSISAVTGSSGSGKNASSGTHHPLRSHNMKSYKIGIHRHIPEILQSLELAENSVQFVPTSGPFVRGIHATAFIELAEKCSVENIYENYYAHSPFVRIKKTVELVEVVGSNFVDISVCECNGKIVVQCVIDNLVKGSSGSAIQNMNLMFGLPEETGLLSFLPVYP